MFNSFPQPRPDVGGNNIKSMQSGQVSFNVGIVSLAVPIADVNLSRSVVILTMYSNNGVSPAENVVRAQLTSSNNVQLDRSGGGNGVVVNWQVIEFYNVKSLQRGNISFTTSNVDVIISPVNYVKTMYFWSYYNTATAASALSNYIKFNTLNIPSLSQMTFGPIDGTGTKQVHWQVVEFN